MDTGEPNIGKSVTQQGGNSTGEGTQPRPGGDQDSPFWVSLVEQMSVEIWKLSRVDTAKAGAAPLTRNEEPERSFGSDRFRSEGRDR